MNPNLLTELVAKIRTLSVIDGDHLIWQGRRAPDGGTPIFAHRDRRYGARRVMHEHIHGRAPQGRVRATCNTPLCVAHIDDTATRQRHYTNTRYITGKPTPADHCTNGHDRTQHGTVDPNGIARCLECDRLRKAASREAA